MFEWDTAAAHNDPAGVRESLTLEHSPINESLPPWVTLTAMGSEAPSSRRAEEASISWVSREPSAIDRNCGTVSEWPRLYSWPAGEPGGEDCLNSRPGRNVYNHKLPEKATACEMRGRPTMADTPTTPRHGIRSDPGDAVE